MKGRFVAEIEAEEARLEHGQGVRARQQGLPPDGQGRLLPRAPGRCRPGHALGNVPDPRADGHSRRSASPRSGEREPQMEIGTKFSTLVERADWLQLQKYVIHNVAFAYGKTWPELFMPKPIVRRQRLGHARPPVGLEGRQEPVRGRRLCRPVGVRAVLHRRHLHQACPCCAERDHEPDDQQLQASGFRATKRRSNSPTARATARPRSASRSSPIRRAAASRRASRIRWPTRTWRSRQC